MSERSKQDGADDAEDTSTNVGEGTRGNAAPSRGGTFRQTPGESGDAREPGSAGRDTPIPHRQDE